MAWNGHEKCFLYNYDVPNDKLYKFLSEFENNTLNGTIVSRLISTSGGLSVRKVKGRGRGKGRIIAESKNFA